MEQARKESTQETMKIVASEDQVTPWVKQTQNKMKPIFPRRTNSVGKSSKAAGSTRSNKQALVSRSGYTLRDKLTYSTEKIENLKKYVHSISMNLQRIHFLEKLSLCVSGPNEKATDLDLYDISETLKKLISLQSFSLRFANCFEITDKGFYHLGQSLKTLPSLRHFEFPFGFGPNITNKGLSDLGQSIKRLTCLEMIKLDLSCCRQITEFGISTLSANLKNLHKLKSLSLHFPRYAKMTGVGFLNLCDSLKEFVCLQNFSLSFRGVQLTDAELKRLGEVFTKLIWLRNLDLILDPSSKITDSGLHELFKGIEKLVGLQNLKIEISSFGKIGNQGLSDFSKALRKLANLKTLEIKFHGQRNCFTDEGLSHIGQGLEGLKSLEKIHFVCSGWWQITDLGLEMLGRGLAALVLLQSVRMDLFGLEKITDFGGQNFCQVLKSLSNLRIFGFRVKDCPQFTDTGLFMMCQVLKDISTLQKFETYKFTLDGHLHILEILKNPVSFPNFPGRLSRNLDKEPEQNKKPLKRNFILFACIMIIVITSISNWFGIFESQDK